MEKTKILRNLIHISHYIGSDISFVQGGGGNTSAKINGNLMAIKASGVSLKDMSIERGISIVDFKKVNSYHESVDVSENQYSEDINSFSVDGSGRPSIETGFHALLGKYVIHSHSVFMNILLCSEEGKDLIFEYFPNSIWVDYCTPGKDLTQSIKNSISDKPKNFEGLIFLESHGMIASASSAEKCLELHSYSNKLIKSEFNLPDFKVQNEVNFSEPKYFIFPDQAIYMINEQISRKTKASIETISTVQYLESNIKKLGLTLKKLSVSDVEILNNMESEKYRKKLSK